MKNVNIELDGGLEIEIEYSIQPEEKESWGYNGGHPHIPKHVDEFGEIELIKGSILDLCSYIDSSNSDFFDELEVRILEEEDR